MILLQRGLLKIGLAKIARYPTMAKLNSLFARLESTRLNPRAFKVHTRLRNRLLKNGNKIEISQIRTSIGA